MGRQYIKDMIWRWLLFIGSVWKLHVIPCSLLLDHNDDDHHHNKISSGACISSSMNNTLIFSAVFRLILRILTRRRVPQRIRKKLVLEKGSLLIHIRILYACKQGNPGSKPIIFLEIDVSVIFSHFPRRNYT